MSPRFVLVCGGGGVGKTTVSAALGLVAARAGERVLVVTVDPARRLAQALGLDGIGHVPVRVDVPGGAAMHVAMLDTKAGWDALVSRHAPDAETARRILANGLYVNITARFVNSHDYISMEQVHEFSGRDDLDLVVIDTPPSRNALDLLDAPRRMREFFSGRLLQWLTLPYRSRLLSAASRPFLQVADRLLGARFLSDIAEFFTLLQTMDDGFVARARELEALLVSDRVTCTVVTSAEPAAATEARFLVDELARRGMHLDRVIVNRVVERPLVAELPSVDDVVAQTDLTAEDAVHALEAVRSIVADEQSVAARHAAQVASLRAHPGVATATVVVVPDREPTSVAAAHGAVGTDVDPVVGAHAGPDGSGLDAVVTALGGR